MPESNYFAELSISWSLSLQTQKQVDKTNERCELDFFKGNFTESLEWYWNVSRIHITSNVNVVC